MQFSGKITNSVLVYLSSNGFDRSLLYETTEVPLEFMNDPTSWIPAADVESFLAGVYRTFSHQDPDLIKHMGQRSAELRGWGVLDSVLRMIQRPQDIFAHPQRLISYFISPAPPIGNMIRESELVRFDLPISDNEYPLTVTYLTGALEGLPRFWSREMARAKWQHSTVQIDWSEKQQTFLPSEEMSPNPELVQSLVHGVEMAHAQVEARDLEIARLEEEIRELKNQAERLKRQRETHLHLNLETSERESLQKSLLEVRENVLHLTDYLTRCQQVLTIARVALRQDPQVMSALRKIDWETIRGQYPWLHLQIIENLNQADQLVNPRQIPVQSNAAGLVDVQQLLNQIVLRLQSEDPTTMIVKQKSFVDSPQPIDVEKAQVALWQVVSASVRDMDHRGELELFARRDGEFLEIQINEHGQLKRNNKEYRPLLQADHETGDATLIAAATLMKQQNGQLLIAGEKIGARKFTCQWKMKNRMDSMSSESQYLN
ncbi:MAG: hypothetical protein K1X29_11230 [Bdellovibrionales bacterium]|nr:hypothetical protein [Bdellovibrionales bacterium]